MRAFTTTRLVLAGVLVSIGALAGCSQLTDGKPVCPGCGTNAEPSFPTPGPSISSPAPSPTATAAPGPGETLPSNDQGYVYVETKSGMTRCQLNSESVECESQFEDSPIVDGGHANGVGVTSDGTVTWVLGNLGNIPVVTLDYGTYSATGWTIVADPGGTRFTNDSTGHGMRVAVEGVESF